MTSTRPAVRILGVTAALTVLLLGVLRQHDHQQSANHQGRVVVQSRRGRVVRETAVSDDLLRVDVEVENTSIRHWSTIASSSSTNRAGALQPDQSFRQEQVAAGVS